MNKDKRGFTLVETIMVVILLGVLGILGTVGLNSAVSSDRGMYERQMESAIRYARNYAMNHFTYAVVVFTPQGGSSPSCTIGSGSGNYGGYAVCACNGANPPVLAQMQNPLSQTANNFYEGFNYNITFTTPAFSDDYIAFSSAGEPGSFSNINSPCSSTFNPLSAAGNPYIAQISFGALPAQSFYIYPDTGLVSQNGGL